MESHTIFTTSLHDSDIFNGKKPLVMSYEVKTKHVSQIVDQAKGRILTD